MNEIDEMVIELLARLAKTTDRPAVELWERLQGFAPIDKKTLARRKRNAKAYQKVKREKEKENVLKSLNDRLKATESTEKDLKVEAGMTGLIDAECKEAERTNMAKKLRSLARQAASGMTV